MKTIKTEIWFLARKKLYIHTFLRKKHIEIRNKKGEESMRKKNKGMNRQFKKITQVAKTC